MRLAERLARTHDDRADAPKYVYFFEEGDGHRCVRSARRQGRGPGRDDRRRASRAGGIHDYDAGVPCSSTRPAARSPTGSSEQVDAAMRELRTAHRQEASAIASNPLLVSVRSGARVSMPGMMDTILNLGLNDETVERPRRADRNERFAWDAYRRFIMMFSRVVLGIEKEHFEELIDDAARSRLGVATDPEIDAASWKPLGRRVQGRRSRARRARVPAGRSRAAACSRSRRSSIRGTPSAPSTIAVTTRFPTTGAPPSPSWRWSSATWATTREPASPSRAIRTPARQVLFGEYLRERARRGRRRRHSHAREDRRSGSAASPRSTRSSSRSRTASSGITATCRTSSSRSSAASSSCCRRAARKRSAEAAVKIALDLVDEGIDRQAHAPSACVDAQSLDQLFHARIDPNREPRPSRAKGLNASPGAAAGQVVFTADDAVAWKERGEQDDPRAHRDDARRRPRHDRRRGRAHRQRRRDLARRRRRARHGQAVRCGMRRADDRPAHERRASLGRRGAARRRLDHDRRHHRQRRARRARRSSGRRRSCRSGSRRSYRGPTSCGAWKCGRTPTRPTTRQARASSARRASGSAAPSTCSCSTNACRSCSR